MKITKRQLRRIIQESCSLETPTMSSMDTTDVQSINSSNIMVDIPVPEDYEKARKMMEQNPELVDIGINMVMELAGTSCERSTAQAIIDHLYDMLYTDEGQEEFSFIGDTTELPGDEIFGTGYRAGISHNIDLDEGD